MNKNDGRFKIKYSKLRDYDRMYKNYITNQYCTAKIAEIEKCNEETVRQALIRLKIPIRAKSDAFKLKNEPDGFNLSNRSVFDGCMLGDASLIRGGKLIHFSKTNKYKDHLLHNASLLFSKDASNRIHLDKRESGFEGYEGVLYTKYILTSQGYDFLIQEYARWYQKNKIVPRDILLDRILVLNWFLDDGCSSFSIRPGGTRAVRIEFATHGFTRNDVQFLREKLSEIGFKSILVKRKGKNGNNQWYIVLSQRQVDYFFEFIGPCPVPSLAYKWKTPDPCRVKQIGAIA